MLFALVWVLAAVGHFQSRVQAQQLERDAVYATQTAFTTSSPIIYTTTGLCIESAVKVRGKIQVTLPPLEDVLAWEFIALAKNLAYIVDFQDDRTAFASSPTGLTIDTAGVSEEELNQGIVFNVTVADVSVGVQFDIASASCHFKLGYS